MARYKGTCTFDDGSVLFFIYDAKRREAIPRLYALWEEMEGAWETARDYSDAERVRAADMEVQPCVLRSDNGVSWSGRASKKRKLIADDHRTPA
jgi:hypothetical protein